MSAQGSRLASIAARLDLTDDAVLAIFQLDALKAIGGDREHLPELEVLDGLTAQAAQLAGERPLARWVHSTDTQPTPLSLLERRDFLAFEDALDRWLRDSGVLGS